MPAVDSPTTSPESSAHIVVNIAAYKFVALDQLEQRRQVLRDVVDRLDLRGTVLSLAADEEPDAIIDARGLRQVADSGAIAELVDAALAANAGQVEQYRTTPADKRQRMFGFFVGQVMKASQGKANPQQVNDLLRERLDAE